MNEVRALISAFDEAEALGVRCALATIVSVEGSAYRRPGARMLVREDGAASTGTISAGCLEGDVAEHARRVIETGRPRLIEYDTASTGDELAWGLGLGCNGIVRVLVEPLHAQSLYVDALRHSCALRGDATPIVVATVFQLTSTDETFASDQDSVGSRLVVDEDGEARVENLGGELRGSIERDARAFSREESSGVRVYESGGGTFEVFVEALAPPTELLIFGAGHDALPIVEAAQRLGWKVEVVDPQARPASRERFAQADKVTLARPEHVREHVRVTPRTLTLLMSHNYEHDATLLKFLLASPARYVGVMGPRRRTERMLRELSEGDAEFSLDEADLSRLYAPAGLDVGANTPAEIALSIVAEMRAVLSGRGGSMLRERRGAIHGPAHDDHRAHATQSGALPAASA